MVLKDLLGPAAGLEEELDEDRVRDRYLVGMLAPRRQELSPEEFDELAEGGSGTIEDGTTDYTAPSAKTLFPSSFGLSFCVSLDASAIQVTARWGHYRRQESETLKTDKGTPMMVWKRSQREGVSPVPLQPGRIQDWSPDPEFPDVKVQGLVRKRDDYWSVTLFLVNGQEEPKKLRDQAWLFQPELIVKATDGSRVFERRPTRRDPGKSDPATFAEEQTLEMLYRGRAEFAVGHGVSVRAETAQGLPSRAVRIITQVVPSYEVSKVVAPTSQDFPALAGLTLDMKELAESASPDLNARLQPLVDAYSAWIREQEGRINSSDFAPYRTAATAAMERCRRTLERIQEGVELLSRNEQAAEAFRFANRAMWLQRIRSLYSERRRRGETVEIAELDTPESRSWYPFQLAFILLNLTGITQLDHPDRTRETDATCDLLWFPTGGGKTEAYLGLSAFTMGLRRLQGAVAGRSGEHGLAVLMRYTLRLLTLQQFQRASALICACEVIRRDAVANGDRKWGETPFRLGLWVGQRTSPNTNADSAEAVKQDRGQRIPGVLSGLGTPHQLTNCPWCGSRIDPGINIKVENYGSGRCRTLIYCGDSLGTCPFSPKQAPDEALPVLVVDEETHPRIQGQKRRHHGWALEAPRTGALGRFYLSQFAARCRTDRRADP